MNGLACSYGGFLWQTSATPMNIFDSPRQQQDPEGRAEGRRKYITLTKFRDPGKWGINSSK